MSPARTITLLAITCILVAGQPVLASFIKVSGKVTDHFTGDPIKGAYVKLYKNGEVVKSGYTANHGRFDFLLDKDAEYVVRFKAEDRATKSFIVDTYDMPKRHSDISFELIVEMKMLSQISSVDLSFFDLPVGIAKYDPGTRNMEWNSHYAAHLKPDIRRLMAQYEKHWMQQQELVEGRY